MTPAPLGFNNCYFGFRRHTDDDEKAVDERKTADREPDMSPPEMPGLDPGLALITNLFKAAPSSGSNITFSTKELATLIEKLNNCFTEKLRERDESTRALQLIEGYLAGLIKESIEEKNLPSFKILMKAWPAAVYGLPGIDSLSTFITTHIPGKENDPFLDLIGGHRPLNPSSKRSPYDFDPQIEKLFSKGRKHGEDTIFTKKDYADLQSKATDLYQKLLRQIKAISGSTLGMKQTYSQILERSIISCFQREEPSEQIAGEDSEVKEEPSKMAKSFGWFQKLVKQYPEIILEPRIGHRLYSLVLKSAPDEASCVQFINFLQAHNASFTIEKPSPGYTPVVALAVQRNWFGVVKRLFELRAPFCECYHDEHTDRTTTPLHDLARACSHLEEARAILPKIRTRYEKDYTTLRDSENKTPESLNTYIPVDDLSFLFL